MAKHPKSSESLPPDPSGETVRRSRVFIVDDHTMFREGLRQLIDHGPGLTVCGDAADSSEALRGIRETRPDVVLVDISLSGASGLDLIKSIKEADEDLPVLVVSMHDELLYAERAMRAGAMGYVMKSEPIKNVRTAIHKVLGGGMYLSDRMTTGIIAKFMRGPSAEHSSSPVELLSDRELEVFRMLGQGKGVREIAEHLEITIATVNSFRNRIKEKLQLKTSTEVMLRAVQWSREEASL
jgi:DNA-binding NarL/FixJ family response regulator